MASEVSRAAGPTRGWPASVVRRAALAFSLVAAGCGGDDDASDPTPRAGESQTGTSMGSVVATSSGATGPVAASRPLCELLTVEEVSDALGEPVAIADHGGKYFCRYESASGDGRDLEIRTVYGSTGTLTYFAGHDGQQLNIPVEGVGIDAYFTVSEYPRAEIRARIEDTTAPIAGDGIIFLTIGVEGRDEAELPDLLPIIEPLAPIAARRINDPAVQHVVPCCDS